LPVVANQGVLFTSHKLVW